MNNQSQFHTGSMFQSLILLGFSLVIFKYHFSGEIQKLINTKYELLSLSAGIILFVLFIVQLLRSVGWWVRDDHSDCCGVGHHDHHNPEHHHNNIHNLNLDRDHHHCHHHGGMSSRPLFRTISYIVFCLPLLTGLLMPAQTLDASMAEKKGVQLAGGVSAKLNTGAVVKGSTGGSYSSKDTTTEVNTYDSTDPSSIDINDPNHYADVEASDEVVYFDDLFEERIEEMKALDTIRLEDENFVRDYDAISFYPADLIGKKIELTGFVYREGDMSDDQLVVSRFIITHCVADAGVVGFLSEIPNASELPNDTWIHVKGTLDITYYNEYEIPMLIIDSWEKVDAPADPYVYP
jgi:putative membrane protein